MARMKRRRVWRLRVRSREGMEDLDMGILCTKVRAGVWRFRAE